MFLFFFFSSRRRHTRFDCDWSSDVSSSDLRQLSGGQRQRVAVGRAIVRPPRVFFLEEPLSNLDAKLRVQMRVELKRLHDRLETTAIYVTHDQVEAMTLGDRVVVMKDGWIQQVGEPLELYGRPANKFVAGFIGSPPMNFVDVKGADAHRAPSAETQGVRVKVPPIPTSRPAPARGGPRPRAPPRPRAVGAAAPPRRGASATPGPLPSPPPPPSSSPPRRGGPGGGGGGGGPCPFSPPPGPARGLSSG